MRQNGGTGLFDLIAPVYSLYFEYQIKAFDDILRTGAVAIFGPKKGMKVLDIGCGTGALLYTLSRMGHQCTGIDPSSRMIHYANKKLKGTNVKLYRGDPADPALFKEGQFDIVFSSYVLHGLPAEKRMKLLRRAYALAGERVVIIDYLKRGGFMTDFLEWLEQGDYFRFVENFQVELRGLTEDFEVFPLRKSGGLFVINK